MKDRVNLIAKVIIAAENGKTLRKAKDEAKEVKNSQDALERRFCD